MASPLEITFEVLARTRDPRGYDVLLSALDLADDAVRRTAVSALIRRNVPREHVEIIRRYPAFNEEQQAFVREQAASMFAALQHCLTHAEGEQRHTALELARASNCQALLPVIIPLASHADAAMREAAREVVRSLVNHMYESLQSHPEHSARNLTKPSSQLQQSVLSSLGKVCSELDREQLPNELVECILILGDAANLEVKKLLWQARPDIRERAGELLLTSPHPGVMDFVLGSLSQNFPHPKALQAVRERDDPVFVCHVLRRMPKRLSYIQQKNLRGIDDVAWLGGKACGWELVPPGLQPALVAFVDWLGISLDQKRTIQEWVLRHGASEGRFAVADGLNSLDKRVLKDVVLDGLDSNDDEVQAWATTQLRAHGIPAAFTHLIDRLDSQSGVIRDAARDELSDFNLHRVLGLYEHLAPETLVRVGRLIQKIDPDCVAKLRREMANPVQSRRVRAARAAEAMRLQRDVLPALLVLTEDPDTQVRRTAAEILGRVPDSEAVLRLKQLMEDASPRVREAAARSLAQIEGALFENLSHPAIAGAE